MTNRYQEYLEKSAQLATERAELQQRRARLPQFRLLVFAAATLFAWHFWPILDAGEIVFCAAALLLFLFLGKKDREIEAQIARTDGLIKINKDESEAVQGNFSAFDAGREFIDPAHPYTHDLDVFGENALFQAINRSVTVFGKNRLAAFFQRAFDLKNEIRERQHAVRELAENQDFRHELRLIFSGEAPTAQDRDYILAWLASENPIARPRFLRFAAFALPVLTWLWMLLWWLGHLPSPGLLIVLNLLIVSFFSKKIMKTHAALGHQFAVLRRCAQGLDLIEKTPFESALLRAQQDLLRAKTGEKASDILRRLADLLNRLDSNLNMLAAIVLNGLFLMNLHLLLAIGDWKNRFGPAVERWFEVLGEVDALASLGNFAWNNPDFSWPELAPDGEFRYTAIELGHPMIRPEKRVSNDFELRGWNQFRIVTGANMAGKSTFLRTVGANLLLGMVGAPVCAKRLVFSPIEMHTSIRTSDSLAKSESYFYAELKRLAQIVAELRGGETRLILLDEILKGTNSADKQAGSLALIRQLLHFRSVGLFATHDLVLGDLEKSHPENVQNLCFEIDIRDGAMHLDYKLRPGVCKNLNATFLMREMGILG